MLSSRICANDYVASQQDMLQCRIRTSGIVEEEYVIDDVAFVVFDVGGQRNERKKWIHCFEDVTAVIFVAALSEYDQTLYEQANVNRMSEALTLFRDIVNNQYFTRSAVILFLNKKDLFEVKVQESSIKAVADFSDFDGAADGEEAYDDGINYFEGKFLEQVVEDPTMSEKKQVYTHVTCATDKGNVKTVFNACKETILRSNLTGSGFA